MPRQTTLFSCILVASSLRARRARLVPIPRPALSGCPRLHRARARPPKRGAPLELTASDGTGLRLVALDARAVLEPPLAFTELLLTFDNPEDRVLEGRFRIALPPGAAISRFAMKIGGAWQEGEVVERQRARQAYEDFLQRRQDPALLEQEAGNEFAARAALRGDARTDDGRSRHGRLSRRPERARADPPLAAPAGV